MPTLFERPMNPDESLMHGFLKRALDEFTNNLGAPRIMRGLARDQPSLFFVAAMHLLRTEPPSIARRYLILLLLNQPEVIARLMNPHEFNRLDTIAVFKSFMETDRLLDVRLAHHLPGRYGEMHVLDLQASARVLDILDQISPGRRLIPIMGYLTQHPDPTIAAKAALLVARRIRNPEWVRRHMNVRNSRVRANVVEGLWGADVPYARTTYQQCLRDPSNRVVGNAMVGLHIMGEPGISRKVVRMADDRRIPFRWTAAWVMGRFGRPEHLPVLQKLLRDDSQGVRGAALRGMLAIREASRTENKADTPGILKPAPLFIAEHLDQVEEDPSPARVEERALSLMLDGSRYAFRER